MCSTAQFVDALPKVELHVHLEGSVLPETLLELVHRHGTTALPRRIEELREFYRFTDFDHFVRVYYAICENLLDGADFARIAYETGVQLAAQGVRWAEVTFTPYNHLRRGIPAAAMFAGIEAGRADARRETGIELRWSTDVPGEYGVEAAHATLDALEQFAPEGVISFGLGGPEVARPPFAEAFARARAMGLHAVPHAGETAGAQSVWDAVTHLGADRIGHGVRCLEDPRLVDHLREHRIPLEVCPTSNVRLSVVSSYDTHPLARLIEEGLVVTLNSDDPPMFGTTLRDEYRLAIDTLGLTPEVLREVTEAGVHASFMPPEDKRRLIEEIRAVPTPS